jgi:cyclic pyranopterin phosphate synthase
MDRVSRFITRPTLLENLSRCLPSLTVQYIHRSAGIYHAEPALAYKEDGVASFQLQQRNTRLDAFRASLPPIEDIMRVIKAKSNEIPASDVSDPPNMDWRECVRLSREKYLGQSVHSSFSSYLLAEAMKDTFRRKHSYLRISISEKCSLRCVYCMPSGGVDLTPSEQLLTVPEIERLVKLFAQAGVTKVRLTGGEPTIRKDLPEIVQRISSIPGIKDVGITSNGLVLSRTLRELREKGLNLLNLSLDTLKPDRFVELTRRKGHERVMASIDEALKLGFEPVKVNVVLMKGVNDDELLDFVELTRDKNLNVRFIEYMPFDGNVWSDSKMVRYEDMIKQIESNGYSLQRMNDGYGEVAKNYRVPGFVGSVSFITSMTSAFCSECNRVRLMADGNIKVCLFGNNEVSLRDALREGATDEDMLAVMSAAVDRKKKAHAGMDILHTLKNRPMVKIGG